MNIESDLLYTCIMQLISKYKDEIKERLEINVPTSTPVAIIKDVQKLCYNIMDCANEKRR